MDTSVDNVYSLPRNMYLTRDAKKQAALNGPFLYISNGPFLENKRKFGVFGFQDFSIPLASIASL